MKGFICVITACLFGLLIADRSSSGSSSSSSSIESAGCCDEICGCEAGQSGQNCIDPGFLSECTFVSDLCRYGGGGRLSMHCPCDLGTHEYCVRKGKAKHVASMNTADKEVVFASQQRAAFAVIASLQP